MNRAVLAGVLTLLAACSGDDDAARPPTTTSAATSTIAPVARTEPTTPPTEPTNPPTEPTTTTRATTSSVPTTTTTPPTIAAPLIAGIAPTIEPITAPAGGGIRPLLEWTPVEGAAHYTVIVYAPDGTPYWTWTGTETSVHVGGEPVLDDARPGPSVTAGMTWGVAGLDANLNLVALSARHPIAP